MEQVAEATSELRELSAPYASVERFPIGAAVLPLATLNRLKDAFTAIFEGLDALHHDLCEGDLRRLATLCRAPDHELPLLDATPGQDWAIVARPDVILASDRIVVVELNCDSPAAQFGLHDLLLRAQSRLPTTAAALERLAAHTLPVTPALVARLLELRAREGLVAVCYWKREEAAGPLHWYLEGLARELTHHGLAARVSSVEDLQFEDPAVLLQGRPVSVVYRCFESPEPEDAAERVVLDELVACVARGATQLFTGFRGEICASKTALALLSDEQHTERLPRELVARFAPYVPWTRVVEDSRTRSEGELVDLIPWCVAQQRRLVLKPARGHSGHGVSIGDEVDAGEWQRSLSQAERDGAAGAPWLVQELVRPDPDWVTTTDPSGHPRRDRAVSLHSVFIVDREVVGVLRKSTLSSSLNISGRSETVPAPVWWIEG